MLVEVRPVDVKRWHGKKGVEDFAQPLVLESLFDTATGKYATGLSEDERKRYENITGYDLSNDYDPNKPHVFWNSGAMKIKLPHRTTIFDTDKPLDFIKVKVLKASKFVANSTKEYDEGKYPDALFVIFDEQEEVAIKASRIQKKNKAEKIISKMSLSDRINFIQILDDKSLRKQSPDYVIVAMDELLVTKADAIIELAKKDKADIYVHAAILEALHRNIMTKEGNAVYYMGDRIGDTVDDACKYFLDPNNQRLKAAVLEKLTD